MVMKILTVRRPWAAAIIHANKSVENRTRNIAGDYRGPVAIHAALKDDPGITAAALAEVFPSAVGLDAVAQIRGEIIGVADLVDVHNSTTRRGGGSVCFNGTPAGELCSPWAYPGIEVWHLVLANPRPLPEPIPYRGALGMRTLDPHTTALIEQQLAVAERSTR